MLQSGHVLGRLYSDGSVGKTRTWRNIAITLIDQRSAKFSVSAIACYQHLRRTRNLVGVTISLPLSSETS